MPDIQEQTTATHDITRAASIAEPSLAAKEESKERQVTQIDAKRMGGDANMEEEKKVPASGGKVSYGAPPEQPVNANKLFLVRKVPKKLTLAAGSQEARLSQAEYESLVQRMVQVQIREAEKMADVDENGLECIDLTDDIGATSSRKLGDALPNM